MANVSNPTVLLVDDDVGILKAISRILAPDFAVVAAVTNGRQAIEHVRQCDPDVVVLDLSMPGLNGFETAVELKRIGSVAKILVLTSYCSDEYVHEAIESGASGYVPKHSAWSDLIPALRHVLAGRQVLPCLAPLAKRKSGAHVLRGYPTTSSWLDDVADLLSAALHRGDVTAVALTTFHRDELTLKLRERRWNLAELRRLGRYLVFDVEDASRRIIKSGRLNPDAVVEMVETLECARVACAGGPARRVVIVGEIAVPLCESHNFDAALELERLWDELTRPLPILTVCSYPGAGSDCSVPPELLSEICAHHAVIVNASDD